MQAEIDVKCMHTNFGGRSFSGFGDTATFKNGQFSLSDHGLSGAHDGKKGVGARNAHALMSFNELFCQLTLSSGYTIFRTTKWQICSSDSGKKALSWALVCHTGL